MTSSRHLFRRSFDPALDPLEVVEVRRISEDPPVETGTLSDGAPLFSSSDAAKAARI